jgi:hypothetical protein
MHWILCIVFVCIVLYALYCMHCILCIVFYALYIMHCILCIVFYALYSMHCILCIVLYALYSLHCILCIVCYPLYSVYCIICIVFYTLRCNWGHLSWVIHLQWISPLSSSLQEHKKKKNIKLSENHSELQVPATHASRAKPAPRLYNLYPVQSRVVRCSAPRDTTQPLYNQQSPRKESHFPHGDGQRVPGTGSQGHFNVTSHRKKSNFSLLCWSSLQVWSRQLQTVSPRSGSPTLKKGSCVRVVRRSDLLSVRSYPTGVIRPQLLRPGHSRWASQGQPASLRPGHQTISLELQRRVQAGEEVFWLRMEHSEIHCKRREAIQKPILIWFIFYPNLCDLPWKTLC